MLQSLNHFRSPSFSSLRYLCVSPVLGAHNWAQHSRCSISSAEQKAGISTLSLLVTLHLARSRMAVTSVVARARCWLRFHLLPTRTPGPFCAKLFPAASLQPSVCWCLDVLLPWCSTWHLPSLRDRNGKVRLYTLPFKTGSSLPTILFHTLSVPYILPCFSIFYQIFLLFSATFRQLFAAINSLQIPFASLLLTLQDLVKPVLQGTHTFKLNEIYLNEVWNYCLINSTAHVPCLRCYSSPPGANIYACQDQTEQNKCHQD